MIMNSEFCMYILTQIDNNLLSVTFEGNLQTKTPPKSEE